MINQKFLMFLIFFPWTSRFKLKQFFGLSIYRLLLKIHSHSPVSTSFFFLAKRWSTITLIVSCYTRAQRSLVICYTIISCHTYSRSLHSRRWVDLYKPGPEILIKHKVIPKELTTALWRIKHILHTFKRMNNCILELWHYFLFPRIIPLCILLS